MRLCISSDWHLDKFTSGLCRFDDVTRSVRAVVALAKSERCDGFVFMGDLADPGPAAHRCSAFAIKVASNLAGAGIWSRWLVGNHDVVEDGSGSSTLSPLAAVPGEIHERDFVGRSIDVWDRPVGEWLLEDVLAVALPHPARGRVYEPEGFIRGDALPAWVREAVGSGMRLQEDDARVVIVFGHLTVPGIERGSEVLDMPRGREVSYPVEAIRERWGDRAVCLNGHYHRSYRRAQSPVIVPGSLERLTKSEARNEPGCLILEV